jgi:hypothetical protein
MVDTGRQLPSPSALAWAIDLADAERPTCVVVGLSETEARQVLAAHLVKTGAAANTITAERETTAGRSGERR